ncbi:MAG: hypothetical protein KDC44_23525 [Phaeodactylibacter sp.]|nr:hypothetical protein [Phaeodactylibacter sp.]
MIDCYRLQAALLLLLLPVIAFGQSGWTKKKGEWYAQTDASFFASDRYYSVAGMENRGNTFSSYALKVYAEYGWTDRLTTIVNWPFLKLQQFSGTEIVAGMGDAQVGLKYALSQKLPIAIGLSVDIPTDDGLLFSQHKEPNELGIIEQINLPTSDGEWNFRPLLAISKSFNGGRSYACLYAALNLRTKNYSHQWQSGLELGQFLFDRLWLIGRLNQQHRFSADNSPGVTFLYGEGTTYSAVNLSLLYQLNSHWRLTAGYQNYVDFLVPLRNMYNGATYSIGLAVEY